MARRILQTLSAHGSWSARLTAQLLEFLPLLSAAVAREVLPALPQIVGESDNEVRLLLEALKQLMSAERTLLLPVKSLSAAVNCRCSIWVMTLPPGWAVRLVSVMFVSGSRRV